MSKLLALLATVAPILLCLSACSATYVVRPITMEAVEQLKAEALNHSVVVDYTGGTRAKPAAASAPRPAVAQGEEIGSDKTVLRGVSLDWMTFGTPTDGYRRIASSRVQRIDVIDRGRGAINGLFYGLLSGVAAGVLVGAIAGSGDCTQTSNGYYTTTQCPSQSGSMMKFGLEGGLGAALVCTLMGAAFGYRTTFEF
jgi:hypothetical protein